MAHEITPRTVYCIQCDAFHDVNEHCPNAHRVRTCEHGYNVKDFCYRCMFPPASQQDDDDESPYKYFAPDAPTPQELWG